ncbi:PAS domain-containing protein [Mucilaginibacter sp.]|uniref:PAS domain-containing protein n=1 Tax=Mucilaginibacter sp. TaxID=1882438 RepID=UPI00284A9822|nr:PAS domain-containing protein [Mucilaginibacter sp.]MDR3697732.1 PAS domain-containing protein [Mucilaginibacter sp.]
MTLSINRYSSDEANGKIPPVLSVAPFKALNNKFNVVDDCAMMMADAAGIIINWNKTAEALLGYTENEIIGKPISRFYTAAAIKNGQHLKNLQLAASNPDYCVKSWLVKKSGTKFEAFVQYTALFDANHDVWGYMIKIRPLAKSKNTPKASASATKEISGKTKKYVLSDLRFQKLIENSNAGIILIDRALNIVFRSRSAERISGWTEEKRGNHSILEIVHPADLKDVSLLFDELAKNNNQTQTYIFRLLHAEGYYIWLECAFTNFLHDPDIEAMVCNFKDITEKKHALELLQRSVKELSDYKYALDEAAIVALTDQKGIIKYVNDTFCKTSKFSREEVIGHDHRIINSGYHSKAFIRNLWVTIAGGKIWKGEFRNKAKDGSFYWVDATIVPFLNEKGKPYQYVAIRFDITESKRIFAELEESEKNYSELFHLSPLPMYVFELGTLNFLDVNGAFLDHYGYTREEILSMNLRDIRPPGEIRQLEFMALDDSRPITGTFNHRTKNGDDIQVDIKSNFIKYKGQRARLAIANDITERLNYIKAIEAQNEKLKEISWIQSHVVRAPLARIMGLIPLIKKSCEKTEEKEILLEYLMISANELDAIIKEISDKIVISHDLKAKK